MPEEPANVSATAIPDATEPDGPDPYGSSDSAWLGIDWARHRKTIDVLGTPVNYAEMAPARDEQHRLAVVFVHGLGGCWQNWLENIPHFARHHRVLALDLPGFGDSPAPDWDVDVPAYGRLLLEFCDAVGVSDCAIVGNSMGGFIAAEAATAQPDRFEKVVLCSAAGVSTVQLKRRPTAMVARMLAAGAPLVFRLQTSTFRRPNARARAFAAVFHRPDLIAPELLWEFYTGGNRATEFAEALTSLAGYDILDRLEDVEVPTLIVWGRQDHIVPPADALEFHRRLAHSQLEVFDKCGHVPMAERPVRFNRLLDEFLVE
jgi:pimeloyl-ACP methyl ester carboxylesterase